MSTGFTRGWHEGDKAWAPGITTELTLRRKTEGYDGCQVIWEAHLCYTMADGARRRVVFYLPEGALSAVEWEEEPVLPRIKDGVYLVQQTQRSDLNPTVRRLEGGKWRFTQATEGLPAGDPCDVPVRIIQRLQD